MRRPTVADEHKAIVRDATNGDLPKRIGKVGNHEPMWDSTDCYSCGSAPCGPHPDVLTCGDCADDWPCNAVLTAAAELDQMAGELRFEEDLMLRQRAAELRAEASCG